MLMPRQRARRTKVRYVFAALIPVAIAWLTNLQVEGFTEVLHLTPKGVFELVFIALTLAGSWTNALGALHNKDCTDAMQIPPPGGRVPP